MATVPLGVCVIGEASPNAARTSMYPHYVFEILAHAGVFHTKVAAGELEAKLDELRILVTVGEGAAPAKLAEWVRAGGMWISVGGLCGMEELLGVTRQPGTYKNWGGGMRSLGEGYLVPQHAAHAMLEHLNGPLHYFGGAAVETRGATVLATANDPHGRPTSQPTLLENTVGKGKAILIAPDLTGTVVYIQQGHGITRDGVPSPDGTSPINDGVLKSDDGAVLDWYFDREAVESVDGLSIFMQPIADLWREVLLRGIFYLANAANVALPVLWYWPRQLPAIGHLSHDTDGNDPKLAQVLLDTLTAGEVNSTWCVILPGYDAEMMGKIKSAGHEYATHYDAMSPGLPFCEEQFDRQFRELKQMFNEQPVTNKNHYLRWEGDTELWDWCVKHGIQLDQSKGASKTGEAGFNFGTCHTYFPVRFNSEMIDVLELPTPTQDLFVFAPEAILEPLLSQALKHHGVLHLLFHPAHFGKPQVVEAMTMSIRRGKEKGLEWWTARQINGWERARRTVTLSNLDKNAVTLMSENEVEDATVLLSGGPASAGLRLWGHNFRVATTTLHGSATIELE